MNTPTDKSSQGNEPAKNPAPNVQSTKPVTAGTVAKADPDHKPSSEPDAQTKADMNKIAANEPASDPEFEKALAEKDGAVSAQDQAEIDAAMGNEPMTGVADDPWNKDMKKIVDRDRSLVGRLEQFVGQYKHPVELITQMVRDVAPDTPDEHIVWGASGHILRYGHLRALVMGIDRPRRE